jgi:hypothetical protein
MTKFFSKDLADNVGYGIATEVAAVAANLQTYLQRTAAVQARCDASSPLDGA